MNNNIFSFGDTFWLQLEGTAMGTPAAPLYSIITYGFHENTTILPQYHQNLLYYKRFIDDIFGIWIDTPATSWEQFKIHLNQFGRLQWNIEDLTTSTTFLDLSISIKDNQLFTSTFQKPMNLYLYIPPLSAHPKSCFKGFITGEILCYWNQNTDEEDFISITAQFIQRLLKREVIYSLILFRLFAQQRLLLITDSAMTNTLLIGILNTTTHYLFPGNTIPMESVNQLYTRFTRKHYRTTWTLRT
jgi:hypothetical protein